MNIKRVTEEYFFKFFLKQTNVKFKMFLRYFIHFSKQFTDLSIFIRCRSYPQTKIFLVSDQSMLSTVFCRLQYMLYASY